MPEIASTTYGQFVSLLYDLYMAVKVSRESADEDERFVSKVEIDFLLQELNDLDRLSDTI